MSSWEGKRTFRFWGPPSGNRPLNGRPKCFSLCIAETLGFPASYRFKICNFCIIGAASGVAEDSSCKSPLHAHNRAMIKRLALLTLPLLMVSAAKDDTLAGRVAGEPVECISNFETNSQVRIIDSKTIAYSRTAKRTWITHPRGNCPGLQPFRTLVVERRGSQLCRGDRFRTVRSPATVPSGACFFGTFTPYDKIGTR
jgi:hypothetical protein